MRDIKMGKIRILLFAASILLILNLTNCSLDVPETGKKLYGEGPLVTHYIDADTFKILQHIGVGSVLIETGDSLEIFMRAQQNLIDEMAFAFGDDKFAWGFKEEVDIVEADSIFLTIRMPNEIEGVFVSGVGNITLVGEKQESIYVDIIGLAEFSAFDLEVDVCELHISGSAQCRFLVNEEIKGSITGSGEVWYKGNPEINVELYGEGKFWDAN
jgi:hypothetical protein